MSIPITTLSSPTFKIPSFSRLSLQTHQNQTISCHSLPVKTQPLFTQKLTLERFGLFSYARDRQLGFSINAENGEGQSKTDGGIDGGESLVRGESTMPDRFRYLTKEAPDPPVRWPWFVALAFVIYAWRAVLFELGNWKKAALAIVSFVGYLLKLLLAIIFHFVGDPVTFLIRCLENGIYKVQAFYYGIVRSAPVPELTMIIMLASAVLAIGEAAVPNAVSSQPYLLTISGLLGYAAVKNYISEPLFWTLLLGLCAFSRLVKKRDDITSAMPAAAVLAAVGEPWVRALVMVSYLALAILHYSKKLPEENTIRLSVYKRNSMLTEYFSRLVRAIIHGITIMKRRKILPTFSTDPMIQRYSGYIMQTEKLDPLSELPEPIIHHIMSYLSPKDAARISVLSKRFESAWASFPSICLDETLNMGACKAPGLRGTPKSDECFWSYVEDFLLRRQPDLNLEKFCFRVSLYKGYDDDKPNNTIIDRAIIYAIENNVKELKLDLVGKVCGDFLPSYRLPMEVFSAKTVTVLTLKGFQLESPSQDHLTLDHPLMKKLVVEECILKETLKVSCRKLESVVIGSCRGLERIEIDDGRNLESFSFDGKISPDVIQSCEIDITTTCKSLKYLSLKHARITDEWIKSHVPKFLLLQVLKLHSCKPVRNLHISGPNLKRMELNDCNQLEEVEIYARKLHTFVYCGDLNLSQLFVDSACLHAKLSLSRGDNVIDNEWYSRLRDFLAFFDHCQELEIACNSNKALIVPTELRDSLLPPLYDLEHLKLEISPGLDKPQDLVESLLWFAPHPSTISFVSGSEEKSLKMKYDTPQIIEEDLHCCFLRPIKCWRHHLKRVTMENFEDDEMMVMQKFITKEALRLEAAYDNPKLLQEISV